MSVDSISKQIFDNVPIVFVLVYSMAPLTFYLMKKYVKD